LEAKNYMPYYVLFLQTIVWEAKLIIMSDFTFLYCSALVINF
jgi:hypothetical protein